MKIVVCKNELCRVKVVKLKIISRETFGRHRQNSELINVKTFSRFFTSLKRKKQERNYRIPGTEIEQMRIKSAGAWFS